MASDHRAAGIERLRWSDLRGERFIVSLQEPGPEIFDWLTARLGGLGRSTDIVRCPVGRETLFVKVALGLGLSVVNEAGSGVAYPNVLFRPIEEPDDVLPFSAVLAPGTDNPALRRFLVARKIKWHCAQDQMAPVSGPFDGPLKPVRHSRKRERCRL